MFAYHRPASVAEAASLMTQYGPEARIIAGGQSLIPMMNARSVSIGHLVDINDVSELGSMRVSPEAIRIGATVRQRAVERSEEVARRCSILHEALRCIGSPAIRNRGTVVGCIALADPAGEIPAVFSALGGTVAVRGAKGERQIGNEDFFVGPFRSALRADELVTEVRFNVPGPGVGTAFIEVSPRLHDRATCGVAAVTDGTTGRLAFVGVGPTPVVFDVTGLSHSISLAVTGCVATLEPPGDIHATGAYRRRLSYVLGVRALEKAMRRSEASRVSG